MRFIFITGITKYSNTGIFSGFNSFTDISLNPRYGAILGLTEEEIRKYYGEYLQSAADILKISYEEVVSGLRASYDGFSFDELASVRVYNPWSVLSFFKQPERGFRHYWYRSGGKPTVLTKYMDTHMLKDPKYYLRMPRIALSEIDSAVSYKDIRLDVLLTQAGYLTFKNIDDAEIVTLGYPNLEVASSMAELYASALLQGRAINDDDSRATVKECLSSGTVKDVFEMFNRVVNTVIYTSKAWSDEEACRSAMHVLLLGAALLPRVESPTSRGRSDMDVEINDRYWVFEFKYARKRSEIEARLKEAVGQIRSRRYGETMHGKKLIRVALVFCGEDRRFAAYEEVNSAKEEMPAASA